MRVTVKHKPINKMKTKAQYTEQLKSLKGQYVRLVNIASAEMEFSRIQLRVNGELEVRDEEDGVEFYVRVKDCYAGSSGIGFRAEHVEEIDKQACCYEIVIR